MILSRAYLPQYQVNLRFHLQHSFRLSRWFSSAFLWISSRASIFEPLNGGPFPSPTTASSWWLMIRRMLQLTAHTFRYRNTHPALLTDITSADQPILVIALQSIHSQRFDRDVKVIKKGTVTLRKKQKEMGKKGGDDRRRLPWLYSAITFDKPKDTN